MENHKANDGQVPIMGMTKPGYIYKPSNPRRLFLITLIVALYAIVLPYCYNTAGEPRAAAAIAAQKIADEKWEQYSAGNFTDENSILTKEDLLSLAKGNGRAKKTTLPTNSAATAGTSRESIVNPDGTSTSIFRELTPDDEVDADDFGDNDLNGFSGGHGGFGFQKSTKTPVASSSALGWFSSWFGESKEQKRAAAEQEKLIQDFNERSEDGPMALPPTYLPSAWACLALFSVMSLHALFHLMCYWQVGFKAFSLYSKATDVAAENTYIIITPPENRGKAEFVQVRLSAFTSTLQVQFQRQTFTYTSPSTLRSTSPGEAARFPNGVFTLSTCPIDKPLIFYTGSKGLKNTAEVDKTLERWGKNHLSIVQPSFFVMLRAQLLSPLAIFQVFCALLWLLDEYWTYTMWTLVTVVIMEGTTVFQRNRTQKMLGGMTPQATPVYVYRAGAWSLVTTKDILPGDILSLAFKAQRKTPPVVPAAGAVTPAHAAAAPAAVPEEKTVDTTTDAVIPCDCLLLRGSAVVNESSLTGESVPQMKEAIVCDASLKPGACEAEVKLDMQGKHKVHVFYSGTSLVTVDPDVNDHTLSIPATPDGGALVYALRTGFSSSQGALIQMIEFSQQSVNGDLRETGFALLLLLCFALVAAAYVLHEGMIKKDKTTHELLLKCVIIITSVVPRQFPMQMAMAVNMALMALMKGGIFCTEPFRVPIAGKITHCLFDKTGTLTTDQLVPVGIVNQDSRMHNRENVPNMEQVNRACGEAAIILAGCHSLVEVEGDNGQKNLEGDPIELAAIKGVEWHWDAQTATAQPGAYQIKEMALNTMVAQVVEIEKAKAANPAIKAKADEDIGRLTKQITSLREVITDAKAKAKSALFASIKIVQRHHFSSALQRMSVVAKCTDVDGQQEWYSLVKGSPEAVLSLFAPGSTPKWYTRTYESLAKKGLRVLALAYKRMDENLNESAVTSLGREAVESELVFGGFIAFECKIRADSGIVMKSLQDSGHLLSMLTGDALLTSLHVAKEVHICSDKRACITLHSGKENKNNKEEAKENSGVVGWWVLEAEAGAIEINKTIIPWDMNGLPALAEKYDFVTTEEAFTNVANATGGDNSPLWKHCGLFRVFARMSPAGKAAVIKNIQDTHPDNFVFMCGDGGNDVGALKQADVGMALLAGHANANTTDAPVEESTETAVTVSKDGEAGSTAEDALNKHEAALKKRTEDINALRVAHMKKFQEKYQAQAAIKATEIMKELTAKGDFGGLWGAMKGQAGDLQKALAQENHRFMAIHGKVWDPKKDENGAATSAGGFDMASMMEGMDDTAAAGGMAMIRPGDASVAAPFTSRTPSVRSVVDLIRQGRCTLLSALMQQQIMMLESIIAAYTLSALSLHNARSSERQMMASSWLILTASIAFSYATPLDHMHPLRPLRSLFHPAIFISILGQAAIHIACMSFAVSLATDVMGPEGLKEVTEFFKKARAKEILAGDLCDEDDMMCQFQAYWSAPFLPNLLNTTVFLVETSQMISVFFANYKGRPWMKGMLENHALFLSVFLCVGGVVLASWEFVPQLNELIQLAPFPDDVFRYKVVALVLATIAGTFAWDRLCTAIFASKIAGAMFNEVKRTKLVDLVPVGLTFLKVLAGLCVLGTGNILLGIGGWFFYKKYTAPPAPKV